MSEQKGSLQAYSFAVSVVPLLASLPSFSSPTLRSSLSSSSLASSSSLDIIPTPVATSPSIGDSPAAARPDVLLIEATHNTSRRVYATQVRREQLPALAGSLQDCRLRLISALEQKARFLTATISQPLLPSASGLELRVVVRDPEEITPDQVLQFYLTPRTPPPPTPSETGSPSSVCRAVDDELVHRLEQQLAEQQQTLRQVVARAHDEATFAGEQRRLMSEQLKSLTERVDKAERLYAERERHHAHQMTLLTQQLDVMRARLDSVQQLQTEQLQQVHTHTAPTPKSPSSPDAAPVSSITPVPLVATEQLNTITARLADLTDAHRTASDRFATFASEVDAREFPLRLNPGWSNFDNHSYPLATFRRQHNRVFLSGMVAGGSGVIAQLPAGYRPTHRILLNAQGDVSGADGRIVRLDIHPDGQIWHSRGPAGWITLTGINFSTVGPAVAPAVLRTSMVMPAPAPAPAPAPMPASSSSLLMSSAAAAVMPHS